METVKEFVPYVFRLFNSKVFSLFDSGGALVDDEINSKLRTLESRRDFADAVNRLKNEKSNSEMIKLDDGKVIEITLE